MSKTVKEDTAPDASVGTVSDPDTFDFTVHPSAMDPQTEWAYGQLRRAAMMRGDQSILPNGKKLTRIEVETILGREIGEADIPRQCCG